MSIEVMSWVMNHSTAKLSERLVLLAIADHASKDGGSAWPSVQTICRYANVTETTCHKALRRLVERGELKIFYNSGPHLTNRYQVIMQGVVETTPPAETTPPQNRSPRGSRNDTPTPRKTGRQGVVETTPEPSLDPSFEPTTEPSSSTSHDGDGMLPGMPRPPEQHTAGELVAAWCRGYTDARRGKPMTSQTARVGKSAKALLVDVERDEQTWLAAIDVVHELGRQGMLDLVIGWTRHTGRSNGDQRQRHIDDTFGEYIERHNLTGSNGNGSNRSLENHPHGGRSGTATEVRPPHA